MVGPDIEVQKFAASDPNIWSLSPSTTAMGLETEGHIILSMKALWENSVQSDSFQSSGLFEFGQAAASLRKNNIQYILIIFKTSEVFLCISFHILQKNNILSNA